MKVQEEKKPITNEILNEAKEALSIATMLLLCPDGGRSGDKAYYANFLMRMNVEWGDKIPTAGVSITDRINFFINPHFLLSLNVPERMELIIHEVEHIVNLHPFRSKQLVSNANQHRLFNIAADANINQSLPVLTQNHGVTIDRINEQLKEMGSKHRLSYEDYAEMHYEKLKMVQDEMPEDMGQGDGGAIDDHSMWEESDGNEELAKAVVQEAANKAAEQTGIGNLPSHISSILNELNKSVVNWKRQMQQFAVRTLKFEHERTRTRRNRRFGTIQQGKRKEPKVKLAVCVDSSGSVSEESFTQFFAEVAAISALGIEITIIDADCSVAAVYKYDKKKPAKRYGNGGTAYSPAIKKAKELKVDGIIYFGDMDAADKPVDPKLPFLWAIVGQQNPPASFGKAIRVTEKNR